MGARGTLTTSVEQAQRKNRLKDIASHTVAGLIATCLSDEEQFIASLQELDNLSEKEAAQVVKEMKAIQKRIDPYGDWRD